MNRPPADPLPPRAPLARLWLLCGVVSLAVAGLFALVLVAARTPALASLGLFQRLFHEALVVHVDLSVLVWFLAVACMIWSMEAAKRRPLLGIPFLEQTALGSFAAGALILTLSPLDSRGEALMSNYIPVIANAPFFYGLALVTVGVALQLLHYFLHALRREGQPEADLFTLGAFTAALMALVALACFAWSHRLLPAVLEGQHYYELLFWGGGHVLQTVHAQFLLLAWAVLAAIALPDYRVPSAILRFLLLAGFAAALISPLAYFWHDVTSQDFRLFFTRQMIVLSGIGPAVLGVLILTGLLRSGRPHPEWRGLWAYLLTSLLLFGYGGLIGLHISAQDVTIPAHYHGSIVGITLAFMGLAVALLPVFGYRAQAHTRLAFWQPVIYGGGQAMHITGLAWSGGYGVLRKTPGALEGGFTAAKAAMGLMGLGGALAVIGGFLFVVLVGRAVLAARRVRF